MKISNGGKILYVIYLQTSDMLGIQFGKRHTQTINFHLLGPGIVVKDLCTMHRVRILPLLIKKISMLYKCFSKDVLNAIALNQRSRHLHIIFFVVNVVHPS